VVASPRSDEELPVRIPFQLLAVTLYVGTRVVRMHVPSWRKRQSFTSQHPLPCVSISHMHLSAISAAGVRLNGHADSCKLQVFAVLSREYGSSILAPANTKRPLCPVRADVTRDTSHRQPLLPLDAISRHSPPCKNRTHLIGGKGLRTQPEHSIACFCVGVGVTVHGLQCCSGH
jgi:hypothetical protein